MRDPLAGMRARRPYVSADIDLLLQSLIALGGEVFVLRAELEAMRRAGGPDLAGRAEAVRLTPDFQAWMAAEEIRFGRHMLDPTGRLADGEA